MAGFLNANLPSDDESDEDFVPVDSDEEEMKREGEARRAAGAQAGPKPVEESARTKRARQERMDELWATLVGRGGSEGGNGGNTTERGEGGVVSAPQAARKRARLEPWEVQLGLEEPSAAGRRAGRGGEGAIAGVVTGPPRKALQVGDLVGLLARADAAPADAAAGSAAGGRAPLPPSSPAPAPAAAARPPGPGLPKPDEEATARAAAALEAALMAMQSASAQGRAAGTVTETRRFAGREVTITRAADARDAARAAGSAAAPPPPPPPAAAGAAVTGAVAPPAGGSAGPAASTPASGLDGVLAGLQGPKKVSVIEKSKSDWSTVKEGDKGLEEELEKHQRSGERYLDKQAFLSNVERNEYERQRDARLRSDMRTRGRL